MSYFSNEDASPTPQFKILFNTDVSPAEAAKHLTFVDAGGARAAAHVEQTTDPANQLNNFDTSLSNDRTLLTWTQRFAAQAPIPAAAADDKTKTPLHRNILVVSPEKPLPPGKGWQLVVDAGLPSAEWK